MTLPASGAISLGQIATEFGLAANSAFPTAFYGKGGAPASGVLSFADFYGRSNTHTAVAAPNPTEGSSGTSPVITGSCVCSVSGGVGPFTYAWVKDSGGAITALTPAVNNTAFQATGMGPGDFRTASFHCNVTDTGNGNLVTASNSVTVNCERS